MGVTLYFKLEQQDVPTFDRSREFVLETDHDLEMVLRIMKRLAQAIALDDRTNDCLMRNYRFEKGRLVLRGKRSIAPAREKGDRDIIGML